MYSNSYSKMMDRLEKMRMRATGNGVTQCLICQTEFGLLASKSYAAMCLDCRKVMGCLRSWGGPWGALIEVGPIIGSTYPYNREKGPYF